MQRTETRGRAAKIGLGALLVATSILGGNTGPDVNSDIVTLATFAFGLFALGGMKLDRIGPVPATLVAASLAVVAVQLLPIGWLVPRNLPAGVDSVFLTFDVLDTVRALLTVACVSIILIAVMTLDYDQAAALTPFLYVGLACNLVLGALNFSAAAADRFGEGMFSYNLAGGFFVNPNHFSTYMLMFVPFAVFEGLYKDRVKLAIAMLLSILVLLLAAGSLAGVSVAALAMVLSVVALLEKKRLKWPLVAILGVFAAIYLYGLDMRLAAEGKLTDAIRVNIWGRTLHGIWENLVFGVGYGAYTEAYTVYELPADIRSNYINHAHNDYLELIMEGGVLAIVLLAAYGAALVRQTLVSWSDPFKRCAAIAIAMMLITSLVDYPGRTFAVLYMFAFANGILFHIGRRVKIPSSKTMKVSIDGVEQQIPVAGASDRSFSRASG